MNASTTLAHADEEPVQRIATDDIPWLPYALIPNTQFRVLQVDEDNNIVILNFKMPPHTVTPVHAHHCTATAYTLEGEWFYDDLSFQKGDIAFETTVEVHQPVTRERGAILLTTLIGGRGNDKLLEDHHPDGSTTLLRTRLFKACERITPKAYAELDFASLLN
ncbi:cupin domain-containing protein [Sphingobium sp. CR2-8]|uniref:cupin domain-containing protein n=1 Tax=Sphingobium sp. CR2-8 TaxID=1306534 RepID=UPI002DBA6894|nr:cupin domain-containing protein [Sphingobium sp. CR2-8]MEC3909127.1 cupin domain-containing protein [Sphingobium sp. CR2-8]